MIQYLRFIVSIVADNVLFRFPGFLGGLKNVFGILTTLFFFVGCSDQPYEDEIIETDASGRSRKYTIHSLILVDAALNQDIGELINGNTFDAAGVNIRAESDAASVIFELSGAETHRQVESEPPFALKGDNAGTYTQWNPTAGDYTLKITPYSGTGGTGRAGKQTIISFSVKKTAIEPSTSTSTTGSTEVADYYFNQDFTGATLTGTGDTKKFSGWDLVGATSFLEYASIWAIKSPYTDARMDNTIDGGRRSLYFQVNDDDPSDTWTTRTQMSMSFKDLDIGVYHTSHRMYLSPDLSFLTNYSETLHWITLFELWNKRNPDWDGDIAGSSRISLSITKVPGIGQPLNWKVSSQFAQPQNILWQAVWPSQTNTSVPVPIGKWFTLDVYLKRGEGTAGQFKVAITPDGGQTAVLFDVKNHTVYPNHPELTLKSWQVFKFYFSDTLLDWLRSNNKVAYALYNDLKWYKQ